MTSSHRPTKTLRLRQFSWPLELPEAELRVRGCRDLGLNPGELAAFRIARRAVDARRRNGVRRIQFVGHLDFVVPAGWSSARARRLLKSGRLVEPKASLPLAPARVAQGLGRVVILGGGPAGLAAALVFAEAGVPCQLVERGPRLDQRARRLVRFHRTRELDPEANLLFGEGGAGTYSDGKIYTRVDDPLEEPLLQALIEAGAPRAIAFDSLAHIGTDKLHKVLPKLRERLERGGVEFLWDTRVDGMRRSEGTPQRILALETTRGELACDALFVAPGHSARDTWAWLRASGVEFEARPFQLGVRIEHPQELIDAGRWGERAVTERLGPASYNLVAKGGPAGRGAHSFCMCPGGRIVASIQEPGLLCTNGMSNSRHSSGRATAALVTTLHPSEFGTEPFAGVAYQEALERRFFEAGGSTYAAPSQTAADFLARRATTEERRTTYPFGALTGESGRLDKLLPEEVAGALARGLERFERMLPGFASDAGLLVGVETRSSGPVRMPRDETGRARGFENLFPVGEGAGFAGGIMSAMIDGARAARAFLELG